MSLRFDNWGNFNLLPANDPNYQDYVVGYGFNGGGQDRGPMCVMANPENPGAQLVTYNACKQMDSDGSIWYAITIKNLSNFSTNFSLSGFNWGP